ncbi:MAG: PLP-dependent aminotransferase family protein [Thermoanaerobaculia bacterium]
MDKQFHDLFSSDARNFRPSAIRAFARLINDPNIISFAGGVPSPATFPVELVARCADTVIRTRSSIALQYGPTPGLPRLRDSIASISRSRGIECAAEDVMVTTGSQQALDLVAHVLLDPGDVVLVELPTYIGASSSFYARSAELAGVCQDDEGIVPEDLRAVLARLKKDGKNAKFLYTIPNFQNPSGRVMKRERRAEVNSIAAEAGIIVVEDDPYGEVKFDPSTDTTPIKALGESAHVVYLGSFSKVLAPGLRCGWILADPLLLRMFELAKEAADLCSGMLDQSIVDELCASGDLPSQIERVREFYRARCGVLMDALQARFAGRATWTQSTGGLFTFLTLNDRVDTREWVRRSIDAGVAYVPGAPFFVDGSGLETMRLTFAKEPDDRLREGIDRLARVFLDREG